jgi:crossover junction endodeoxyribonuclease RuvC
MGKFHRTVSLSTVPAAPLRVLGVDPGTVTAGWGVVEKQGPDFVFLGGGAITTRGLRGAAYRGAALRSLPERLRVIYTGLTEVITKWAPQALSLEKAFLVLGERRNVQSALRLGEARGVVLLAAAQAGLAVHEYSPAEIKMAVVGYGRADKDQVQKGVISLLLQAKRTGTAPRRAVPRREASFPTSKDATDALAAALCHLQSSPLQVSIQQSAISCQPRMKCVGAKRRGRGRGVRGWS